MSKIYRERPANPEKWAILLDESKGLVHIYNGKKFVRPECLTGKTPISVDFHPLDDVMLDLYVNGEHKLRILEDRTFEIIGGVDYSG